MGCFRASNSGAHMWKRKKCTTVGTQNVVWSPTSRPAGNSRQGSSWDNKQRKIVAMTFFPSPCRSCWRTFGRYGMTCEYICDAVTQILRRKAGIGILWEQEGHRDTCRFIGPDEGLRAKSRLPGEYYALWTTRNLLHGAFVFVSANVGACHVTEEC